MGPLPSHGPSAMTQVTPRMLELARRLIEHERIGKPRPGKKPAKPRPSIDFSVIERLRPSLVTLMSTLGFQALLLRAQALSSADIPWIAEVMIHTDGSIGERAKRAPNLDPEEIRNGNLIFLAHVLMLLEAFIGEVLTLQLMIEVWPNVPLDDLDSGTGETHEKAT